jgi:hypothetical protein
VRGKPAACVLSSPGQAGFALGHLVGGWFGLSFLRFGSLNGGAATVGCFIFLAAGDWLGRIERTA